MSQAWNRRRFVAAAALGPLSFAGTARGDDAMPFRVGLSAPANTVLAIWMADDAGLYKARGLDVALQKMAGGSQSGPELSSGHIQAMHIGLSSIVRANLAGADLRCIGSLSNIVRFSLLARPGTRPADLKGGVIGISSLGSETDATLGLALNKLGLTRDDVSVREVGVDPQRIAALQDGTIRATLMNEPGRSQAVAAGFTPMVDLQADRVPWIFTGLAVDRRTLASRRGMFIDFLKATIEGNYLALSDDARARRLLTERLNLTDPKILAVSYTDFRQSSPPDVDVSRAGAENVIAQVARGTASHDVNDYVDFSPIAEIAGQGFMTAMKQKYRIT